MTKILLEEVCEIKGRIGFRGYSKMDIVEKGQGAISLSPSNIKNNKLNFFKNTYINWKKYNESPEIKISDGDVIFCKTASVGKIAFVENLPEKSTINPQLVVFKKIKCLNKFLFYYLSSSIFQNKLKSIVSGSSIPTLTQNKLGKLSIFLPSDKEQKRIVNILDKSEMILEKIKISLNKIDYLPSSIFNEMFENSKLSFTKKDFVNIKLKDFCKLITDGTHISPKYTEEGVPMLDGKHILDNFFIDDSLGKKFISTKTHMELSKRCKPQKDDILISSRGSIGKIAIVREGQNFNIMGNMILIRPSEKLDTIYFAYYLKKIIKELNHLAQGVAQKGLYLNQVRNLTVSIPEIENQKKFSSIVKHIQSLRQKKIKSYKKFETLIHSLDGQFF